MTEDRRTGRRLTELYERLSRKIDMKRTVQLSAEELDWLVVSGAYAKLNEAAVREVEQDARLRLQQLGYDLSGLDHLRSTAMSAEPPKD